MPVDAAASLRNAYTSSEKYVMRFKGLFRTQLSK